jgi:hypothetical protein
MYAKKRTVKTAAFAVTAGLMLFCTACSRKTKSDEAILVRIGDKTTISVNEFIRRAEYIPRPDYCRQNSYIQKKIVLNSLIAEKLLALEAGEDNPVAKDEEFQLFIKGRKEQAMRQWMHHQDATSKVVLDPAEIKRAFELAGREYKISYFSSSDTALVNRVKQQVVTQHEAFKDVYYHVTGDTLLPQKEVSWASPDDFKVHDALFAAPLKIGQVLPPIKTTEGDYLFIKINGWSDDMVVTEKQLQERLDNITEKLTQQHSAEIWNQQVAEIMRGRRMDIDPAVFKRISQLFYSIYFRTDEERREQLADKIWSVEDQEMRKVLQNLPDEQFQKQPFFKVGDEVWTVADFQKSLISHPLVFRERRMPSNQFDEQFRLAIADLVRDEYVTREAYKRGYDRADVVERDAAIWRDAYLALYQRTKYLKSVGETRNFNKYYHQILQEHLNPYVRELEKKYDKKVELDFDAFEKISLTSIDLFVKQPDQPFKYVTPNFPILTSDHLIDYIAKMR